MLDSNKAQLQVLSEPCGFSDGEPLYLVTIRNDDTIVELTNLGASITAIFTADRNGVHRNIVAGYEDISRYRDNPHYFGCILGRYAGRIAGAKFELDGEVISLSGNDGVNHLHGGIDGLNKKVWKIKSFIREDNEAGVLMEYLSPDGDEGYPGNLWVTVKYILDKDNKLKIIYDAVTDKSTPVNLSNHSYFNLSGFVSGDVLKHTLQINASAYTENDEHSLPTGRIIPVDGTPVNFLSPKEIGTDIMGITASDGYNHNFVLNDYSPGKVKLAATLSDAASGRVLNVYTDRPGLQVYTANDWTGDIIGPQGLAYHKHAAVALETQFFPDSPNHPGFPDTILRPGQRLISETIYEFSVCK
ncbi:aldose epimerase family protein [Mucilaginibacter sp.]|uniref:aldose epimerase family protein n=1 Tax=Mucilaginibacter sp. TaxID=1882438 RepID=UPI0025E26839|nr:aldose epimerase family protein [Mucilaginibacter sp.]